MAIQQIPSQPIEIRCSVLMPNDQRTQITFFPLASHGHEAPVDTLEGFLNRRRADFFPVRLNDGTEIILSLNDCLVFDLTRAEEERLLAEHPGMSREPVLRNEEDVASHARVSLIMRTGRRIQGTIWFQNHVPPNHRNLLDVLNSGQRYLLVHNKSKAVFVKTSAVVRAEIRSSRDDMDQSPDADVGTANSRESLSLVDVGVDFTGREALAGSIEVPVPPPLPDPTQTQSDVFAENESRYRFSPLANSAVFPKPRIEVDRPETQH